MPNYRLVFSNADTTPIRSVDFSGIDAGDALVMAQRHDGPAHLWEDEEYLCTLRRTGSNGEIWIISGDSDRGAGET